MTLLACMRARAQSNSHSDCQNCPPDAPMTFMRAARCAKIQGLRPPSTSATVSAALQSYQQQKIGNPPRGVRKDLLMLAHMYFPAVEDSSASRCGFTWRPVMRPSALRAGIRRQGLPYQRTLSLWPSSQQRMQGTLMTPPGQVLKPALCICSWLRPRRKSSSVSLVLRASGSSMARNLWSSARAAAASAAMPETLSSLLPPAPTQAFAHFLQTATNASIDSCDSS
mmetsp:Transcript_45015/g.143402  ORF Transcript_45015/g.143402 Transcript_45015/m.143402 type:complete len:225 (-) Transcript_45015:806-1480(-)